MFYLKKLRVIVFCSKRLVCDFNRLLKIINVDFKIYNFYDIIANSFDNIKLYFNQIDIYDYIIISSRNCLLIFIDIVRSLGIDFQRLSKVIVIGEKTYRDALSFGIKPFVCPDDFSSDGIIHSIRFIDFYKKNILIPKSSLSDDTLDLFFFQKKAFVYSFLLYYNKVRKLSVSERYKIFSFEPDYAIFTSPSSVIYYKDLIGDFVKPVNVISIGARTASFVSFENVFRMRVARKSTVEATVESIFHG